ncbi:MAG: bile acid:sodium symporter family protein [Planctomycetota bacterium]|nr:MAG: bile acid:sodium symporter family protein [Planctomycetota bacterium]
MLQRWLHIWLLLCSAVAYFWPQLASGLADPFVATKAWLSVMISGVMFCVGCLLPRDEVIQVGKRWPTILMGTAVQYLSMPLLGWSIGKLLQLPEEQYIGLMLAACVPGAMASNVITMTARGNVSFSVGLTTMATLICPLVTPLMLRLTLGDFASQKLLLSASSQLFREVVIPVLLGFAICQKWPAFGVRVRGTAAVLANLTIIWLIATFVALSRDKFSQVTFGVLTALLLVNVGGYLAGYWGGRVLRFDEAMSRALMIEVGMQNAGLGAKLAGDLFPDKPGATVPCTLYAFLCVCSATMLARWLSGKDQSITDSEASR